MQHFVNRVQSRANDYLESKPRVILRTYHSVFYSFYLTVRWEMKSFRSTIHLKYRSKKTFYKKEKILCLGGLGWSHSYENIINVKQNDIHVYHITVYPKKTEKGECRDQAPLFDPYYVGLPFPGWEWGIPCFCWLLSAASQLTNRRKFTPKQQRHCKWIQYACVHQKWYRNVGDISGRLFSFLEKLYNFKLILPWNFAPKPECQYWCHHSLTVTSR